MSSEKSWSILELRLITLLREIQLDYPVRDVLQTLRGSLQGAHGLEDVPERLARILVSCCAALREIINDRPDDLTHGILEEYYEMTMTVSPLLRCQTPTNFGKRCKRISKRV